MSAVLAAIWRVDVALAAGAQGAESALPMEAGTPWWIWPILLFFVCLVLGIVAPLAGVGGGVLFVPIVGSFFPFGIDFVRGAGLMVALAGSIAAGPRLLRDNLASLRLGMLVALVASASSLVGAVVGLALPQDTVQVALGGTILAIVAVMAFTGRSEHPPVEPDRVCRLLGINGVYREQSLDKVTSWSVHRTLVGCALFIVIGFMAGMFGLGAGWANVPVLNLVMGAPLKVSVATSSFLLSITDTPAAWVYINTGAILPVLIAPSVVGMMLGSAVGARVLVRAKPRVIRWAVLVLLTVAGLRALLKGTHIWM